MVVVCDRQTPIIMYSHIHLPIYYKIHLYYRTSMQLGLILPNSNFNMYICYNKHDIKISLYKCFALMDIWYQVCCLDVVEDQTFTFFLASCGNERYNFKIQLEKPFINISCSEKNTLGCQYLISVCMHCLFHIILV